MGGRGLPQLLMLVIAVTASLAQAAQRSFTIDYDNDCFLKDGEPVQLVSGAMHYYRIHPTDWTDRLRKLRYAGFNTVETYIEWASHEKEVGQYDFSGWNNITDYFLKAQEEGFMVLLRPGPFIDAERDMGGLPYWLLRENPDMALRTNDQSYIQFVDAWYLNALLPVIKPLLYSEGGPIIMVQVENEYGSDPGCDYAYTSHMREVLREGLGDQVQLYTTDGERTSELKCGKVPEVYATVDFGTGSDISNAFEIQRLFEPRGPQMNSEFYTGWIDHWGEPHNKVASEDVASQLDAMLSLNASVNLYVAHGGTSFGLTSGSNLEGSFQSCPTTYDYDAPISEAGDLTNKYFAVRDVVGKYLPLPPMTPPTNSSKFAYDSVSLAAVGSLPDVAQTLTAVQSDTPLTFEALSLFNGVVFYQTVIAENSPDPALLKFESVNDRGYVYLDGQLVGLLAREQKAFTVPVFARKGQTLTVIVESQGRICFGADINDAKGIIGNVMLGSTTLGPWENIPVPLEDLPKLTAAIQSISYPLKAFTLTEGEMMFYNGSFTVPDDPQDTFLQVEGWTKGIAWINDFCLGRYWPVMGPQLTLYVPHGVLNAGVNSITLLELEEAPCGNTGACSVSFTTEPNIDGPTPPA